MIDSYLLLQKKTRIVFFSVHSFQFIVYGKTHEMKLLRLLRLLDSQLEIKKY